MHGAQRLIVAFVAITPVKAPAPKGNTIKVVGRRMAPTDDVEVELTRSIVR